MKNGNNNNDFISQYIQLLLFHADFCNIYFLNEYTIIPPVPNVSLSLSLSLSLCLSVRIWWMDIDVCAQQALQVSTVSETWTSAPVDPVSTADAARTLSTDSSVCVHLVSQVPRVRWAPKPFLVINDLL